MSFTDAGPYFNHPILKKDILQFREYQKDISNSALNKNTLVILPTALGKTIISLLVCINTLYNYRDKRVLVLAPTRPLVYQHWNSFISNIKLPDEQTAVVTGRIPPYARIMRWNDFGIRLLFSTPEVVKNDIIEKRLSLENFFLVIFDEAHRAVKDYAYTFIAKQYLLQCSNPLILGLTASPGSEIDKIQEICNNLFIENIEYKSEDDSDVKRYINPIDLKWEWFDLPSEYQYIKSLLKTMLEEKLNWLTNKRILRKNVSWVFKRDLISLGDQLRENLNTSIEIDRSLIYLALMQQSIALSLMYCIELVESQGFYSLESFLGRKHGADLSKSHKNLLEDRRIMEVKRIMAQSQMEHPKIEYLLKILKQRFDSRHVVNKTNNLMSDRSEIESRVLIFTQYRDTAQHLVELLTKDKIKASRFVGQSKRQGDPGMNQDEQKSILRNFKEGAFNVLVATSIAEEGLDIPEVDLVIFYEPIPSEIRHIQRRGRTGRKSIGSVLILATKDTVDQNYLEVSRRKIKKMKSALLSVSTSLKLKPIHRINIEHNPMTKDEIHYLDSHFNGWEVSTRGKSLYAKNRIAAHQETSSGNDDCSPQIMKDVERIARRIYSLVAINGNKGLDMDLIYKIVGKNEMLINAGLEMLIKLKKLKLVGNVVIVCNNVEISRGQIYKIEIKKVVMGKALVLVNGKWEARLHHYDYHGPRELIRKGIEFNALGELYGENHNLNVRIDQIL